LIAPPFHHVPRGFDPLLCCHSTFPSRGSPPQHFIFFLLTNACRDQYSATLTRTLFITCSRFCARTDNRLFFSGPHVTPLLVPRRQDRYLALPPSFRFSDFIFFQFFGAVLCPQRFVPRSPTRHLADPLVLLPRSPTFFHFFGAHFNFGSAFALLWSPPPWILTDLLEKYLFPPSLHSSLSHRGTRFFFFFFLFSGSLLLTAASIVLFLQFFFKSPE